MRHNLVTYTFVVTSMRICVYSKTISRKGLQTASDLTSSFLSNTQIQNFIQGGLSGLSWPQITNLVKGIFSEIENLEDSLEDIEENVEYSHYVGIGLISSLRIVFFSSSHWCLQVLGKNQKQFEKSLPSQFR